ncbi:segregation/condensation protein A [Microcoleus sp. FACHB-672]|uniref:segregation/condensation protein A n=1 Tax=Microcoleus sp. FACHB-672 TaxID=2692825 RepID=UPI001689704A|nr:ScpA family protein [Microcoleus sp. FACHB-672]MBD2039419.1 segregation/condensation protein A [Microcoleus sp. FACHB-672]
MTVSLSPDAANLNHRGSSAPELGIALLIDLAKQGEINPWDVQVIEVIDRFLSELAPVREAGQLEREVALSQSGQAFLYASMLVLLKADSLARSSEPEDEAELLEDDTELLDDTAQRGPLKLERQLRRRAVAQPPQKRRVTLQELIDQLQLMAVAMEDRPRRARPKKSSPRSSAQVARAITHLAHQENLSEVAGVLERFFLQNWTQISQEHDWLELDQLLERLSSATQQAADESPVPADTSRQEIKENDRVGVFWALLLLSAQSKVELSQEEFYQDLKIRALPESLQLPAAEVDESIKPAS